MNWKTGSLADSLRYLRWAIPLALAALAAAYEILEQAVLQSRTIWEPDTARTLAVLLLVSPLITWLALTWVFKAVMAEAEARRQLKAFSQEMEHKVAERTRELSVAKEELASKAEQLRSLLGKTVHLQESERARIARDMHDGVIQLLTAARYELQASRVMLEAGDVPSALGKLAALRGVLDEMEQEIRSAIYDLHPPVLDDVGLIPALQRYAASFQQVSGIDCTVEAKGNSRPLTSRTEITAFRAVEEALQNVAAHAHARRASCLIEFTPTVLRVTVEDDGRGFDYQPALAERTTTHLGLVSLYERAHSLGGSLEVVSRPECGTQVIFTLPVEGEEVR